MKISAFCLAGLVVLMMTLVPSVKKACALSLPGAGSCNCSTCSAEIPEHYGDVQDAIDEEFEAQEEWFVETFFMGNILPAMALMAEQLTATGIMQVEAIGMFLDAKHQLETQRLFQTMTAKAHKDYHPSEGMCTFGTTVRSLAGSERLSNLAQTTFAQRMMQRQTLNGDGIANDSGTSDRASRVRQFIQRYCDPADNANGLGTLCREATTPARRNIDVDFTRNIESRLTLNTNFIGPGFGQAISPDESDVFALSANLFSHDVAPWITPEKLAPRTGNQIREKAVEHYMDLRSIFAKRSVAQNSFAAIVSMRAAGDPSSAPYTKAIMRELGVADSAEIEALLGVNPSYFAQMEVLTKKLYQNPIFYTELYDKPANVERKGAALQAIGLMQDRDLYNSLLRSEAVLSVLLETMLQREQEKVTNAGTGLSGSGGGR